MIKAHSKRLLSFIFSLFILILTSCGQKLPSYYVTKDFFGYGVSIKESTKSFADAFDGFAYSMEVWSLSVSFTKKITKNFSKISTDYPVYAESMKLSVPWTASPIQSDDAKYAAFSKMPDNRGISVVQDMEILLKTVLKEKGNFYSYAVSETSETDTADTVIFTVFCSERKLFIVFKRNKVL